MVSIILKVRIKMKRENKRGRGRRDELIHPSPYGLEAKGQTAEQGVGWVDSPFKSLSPCRFWWSHFMRRSHRRGRNAQWIWCRAEGFFLLETQLKVITSAASSITSRNKHYNHVCIQAQTFWEPNEKVKRILPHRQMRKQRFSFSLWSYNSKIWCPTTTHILHFTTHFVNNHREKLTLEGFSS